MVDSTMHGGWKDMSMGYGSQLPPSSCCACTPYQYIFANYLPRKTQATCELAGVTLAL